MVPPGIEPGFCPRQGHVLAIGLWDLFEINLIILGKVFKPPLLIFFMAGGGGRYLIALIYLILGVYSLNIGFSFIKLPDFFNSIDKWIIVAGGILLILGAIFFLNSVKYRELRRNVRLSRR